VLTAEPTTYRFRDIPVLKSFELGCWRLTLSGVGTGASFEVFAADPADWVGVDCLMSGHCAEKAKEAKVKGTVDGFKANQWWAGYYAVRTVFGHKLGPRFASTTHKAQGGEWPVVFVDLPDFDQWRRKNPAEHRAMAYTAITRAQNTLHLLGV
jgi:hypothetical protein